MLFLMDDFEFHRIADDTDSLFNTSGPFFKVAIFDVAEVVLEIEW